MAPVLRRARVSQKLTRQLAAKVDLATWIGRNGGCRRRRTSRTCASSSTTPRSTPSRSFSSSLLLSSLELSDSQVYVPETRALLGTASHFCEVVVLKSSPRSTPSRLRALISQGPISGTGAIQPFIRNAGRGGLVFKAHGLCVSLNSRLESNKEEEECW